MWAEFRIFFSWPLDRRCVMKRRKLREWEGNTGPDGTNYFLCHPPTVQSERKGLDRGFERVGSCGTIISGALGSTEFQSRYFSPLSFTFFRSAPFLVPKNWGDRSVQDSLLGRKIKDRESLPNLLHLPKEWEKSSLLCRILILLRLPLQPNEQTEHEIRTKSEERQGRYIFFMDILNKRFASWKLLKFSFYNF